MKLPNFGYHAALRQGRLIRNAYRALAPQIVRRPINPPGKIDIDVFSYSNEAMLPEQIASIRSFLRYAGRPNQFTVVSDGTHTGKSMKLLRQIDSSVRVASPVAPRADLPDRFRRYLANHPTGKQLALIMSLPHNGPTLYVDSDVRFFPGAAALRNDFADTDSSARYLADCQFAGDERLLRGDDERLSPVNTGVLLLFAPLDWSIAEERFPSAASFAPDFFTNQTLTHLVMHQNRARPFDPARYVLRLDDQCQFRDRHASPQIVLRHYVNPVRHKFWTSLSK